MNEENNVSKDDAFWEDLVDPKKPVELPNSNVEIIPNIVEKPIETPVEDKVFADKTEFIPNKIPCMMPCASCSPEYQNAYKRVVASYKKLPVMKFDEWKKEIKSDAISIRKEDSPSPKEIAAQFERVQAAMQRLNAIMLDVVDAYITKKSGVDVLRDAWPHLSTQKGAENRKSEACFVVADFEMDLAETEAMFKICYHVDKFLENILDILSRRVTCAQMELKLDPLARGGSLPDYNFKYRSMTNSAENIDGKDIDPTKPIEASENDFPGK